MTTDQHPTLVPTSTAAALPPAEPAADALPAAPPTDGVAGAAHPVRTTGRCRNLTSATIAVSTALGVQELVAGVTGRVPSLMAGAASWVIDMAPASVVEWAIHHLGGSTKRTLIVGIVVLLIAVAMATSALPRLVRRILFVVVGLGGAIATAHGTPDLVPSLVNGAVAAAAGIGADTWIRRPPSPHYSASRRAFLTTAASVAALAVVAAAGGRALLERTRRRLARRDEVVLPEPLLRAQPVGSEHEFDVEGLEPVVTPNERFYKVDIDALNPPQIDLSDWKLTITGMVDRELSLTFADLQDMNLVEKYVTLSCVSNEVGGRLVGNAVWLGVPLPDLLERAGAHPEAEQVAAFATDGFVTGFPLGAAYDRDTILAIGMNGEPLPYDHGFPARLVVPGYYGFVSAIKWVERIELTTWDAQDSYWVKLGWAKHAPIRTQSRIDAPRTNMTIAGGPRMIAGVAWAPFLGITKVEVQVDDGPWQLAQLSEPLGDAAWVQWQIPWDAPLGDHSITVRATDGSGETQTAEETSPVPSGATGHHRVEVHVE